MSVDIWDLRISLATELDLKHCQLWNRNNHLRTPFACVFQLRGDLFFQIPRHDDDVIGLCMFDLVCREYRNMRTRQVFVMFLGITIHGVVDEVSSNTAIIQKRIRLTRCAIPYDLLAFPLGLNQEFEELTFRFAHLFSKGLVHSQFVVTLFQF